MNTITLNGAIIEIPEGFRVAEMRSYDDGTHSIRLTQDNPYQMYPDSYHAQQSLAQLYGQAAQNAGFYPSQAYGQHIQNVAQHCGSNDPLNRKLNDEIERLQRPWWA